MRDKLLRAMGAGGRKEALAAAALDTKRKLVLSWMHLVIRHDVIARKVGEERVRNEVHRREVRAVKVIQRNYRIHLDLQRAKKKAHGVSTLSDFIRAAIWRARAAKARPKIDSADVLATFLTEFLKQSALARLIKNYVHRVHKAQRTYRSYAVCSEARLSVLLALWDRTDGGTGVLKRSTTGHLGGGARRGRPKKGGRGKGGASVASGSRAGSRATSPAPSVHFGAVGANTDSGDDHDGPGTRSRSRSPAAAGAGHGGDATFITQGGAAAAISGATGVAPPPRGRGVRAEARPAFGGRKLQSRDSGAGSADDRGTEGSRSRPSSSAGAAPLGARLHSGGGTGTSRAASRGSDGIVGGGVDALGRPKKIILRSHKQVMAAKQKKKTRIPEACVPS